MSQRLIMTTVLAVLVSACAHHPPSVSCPDRIDCTFDGIAEQMAQSKTLHMLVVHGMGHHEIGYSRNLMNPLSKELGLKRIGGGGVRRIENPHGGDGQAVLSITAFQDGSGDRRLFVYEVTWAPLVEHLKQPLHYDSEPEKTGQRARVNRGLKKHLINQRLADPILYLGHRREALRHPIRFTLCQLLGGELTDGVCEFGTERALDMQKYPDFDDREDKIVIVTYSLGSKITFDALLDLLTNSAAKDDVKRKLAGRIGTFFMLANQLPLLDLADRDMFSGSGGEDELPPVAEIGRLLSKNGGTSFTVVAISDPNDLLSYDVSDTLALMAPEVRFVNVSTRIGTNFLLAVEPLGAHTGHNRSPIVIRFIARGDKAVR